MKRINVFIFLTFIAFSSLVIYSCVKQDAIKSDNTSKISEITTFNSESQIIKIIENAGFSVSNDLELRGTSCGPDQEPGVTCYVYGGSGDISVPPNGNNALEVFLFRLVNMNVDLLKNNLIY